MLAWIAIVTTASALVWVLARVWRIAAIGSAYRSKVLCSIVFGSSRSIDPQRVEDVSQDSYRLLRLFRSRVDPVARSVTTSLFGLRPRTAIHRPGLGATLIDSRSSADLPASAEGSGEARRSALSARMRQVHPSTAAQRVVAAAFTEPHPKRLRRTRAIVVLRDGEIVAEQYAAGFDATTPLSAGQ